eukprot:962672-Rhodomonas_salina.1
MILRHACMPGTISRLSKISSIICVEGCDGIGLVVTTTVVNSSSGPPLAPTSPPPLGLLSRPPPPRAIPSISFLNPGTVSSMIAVLRMGKRHRSTGRRRQQLLSATRTCLCTIPRVSFHTHILSERQPRACGAP